jgi:predicted short-subunit dehydrogenase-like oxidoreductase (DUF2520 family)
MVDLPNIAIIGPGKVGTSIALLAKQNGYRISALSGRDEKKTQKSAKLIGGDVKVCLATEAAAAAQLVLLTVSDGAIESVCQDLAHAGAFSSGQTVAHVSGALSSEALASARDICGAKIGSLHPLQMFPNVEAALDVMPGSHWFCEGDPHAVLLLKQLVLNIGGMAHIISVENKALYHCASVVACNYLNALMDIALAIAEKSGLDRKTAWEVLTPLVEGTISNIDKLGTVDALTGPIERGDVETVKRHLHALKDADPEISEIYRTLGRWTVQLAHEKGSIKQADEDALKNLFSKSAVRE